MVKYKKLRDDVYFKKAMDDTLVLYDPYIYFSVLPEKSLDTRRHNKKVCISVGRQINKDKVKRFFTVCDRCGNKIDIRVQDECPECGHSLKRKKKIAEAWAKELRLPEHRIHDLITSAMDGVVMNFLLKLSGLAIKTIERIKRAEVPLVQLPIHKQAKWQIFEMFKSNDINEVFQVLMGMNILMGRSIREFGTEQDFIKYKLKTKNMIEKMLNTGFYG